MKIVITYEVSKRYEQVVTELERDGDHVALLEWCDNQFYPERVEVFKK